MAYISKTLISSWEKQRKAILDEMLAQPVLSAEQYTAYMRRYHHIGVKIYRHQQTTGQIPTQRWESSTFIITGVTNKTPYN